MPNNVSPTCIDKVEKWLHEYGIDTTLREGDQALAVKLITPNRKRYTLHFWLEDGDLVYEAAVMRRVQGDPRKQVLFYETLLGIGGGLRRIAFKYAEDADNKFFIALSGSQECKFFTPLHLRDLLDLYEEMYSSKIPRIKDLATELGLVFDKDSSDPDLSKIIRDMLREW